MQNTEFDIAGFQTSCCQTMKKRGIFCQFLSVRYGLEVQWSLVRNIGTRGLRLLTISIANL
jgi:hypothetical protein